MTHRRFSFLLVFLFLGFPLERPGYGAEDGATHPKPNILFILADDVGTEVLNSYGGTSYETPALDTLAEAGMRFKHCYVMPVCHPTRISILSGLYPYQLGNPEWGTYPPDEEAKTFANLFKNAGYATAIAGKWQIGLLREDLQQPFRMGFEEYCLFGWHEGPRYHSPFIYQNGKFREGLEKAFGPEVYTDFLIDFMKKNKEKPFFAFYSMAVCHDVTNDLEKPVPFAPHGRYDSMAQLVAVMDRMVRKMVSAVEELGLSDNTVIVYASDNGTKRNSLVDFKDGEYIYEPVVSKMGDREIPGGKGKLTDWGTHVPLIVKWKGKVKPNQTSDALVDSVDFYRTFADLAGAETPTDVAYRGKSFLPVLEGKTSHGRDWVFAERENRFWVRKPDWKLYGDGQLFNMNKDPEETQPLRPGERHSEQETAVRNELQAAIDSLNVNL